MDALNIYLISVAVLAMTLIIVMYVYVQDVFAPIKTDGILNRKNVFYSIAMFGFMGIACTQFMSVPMVYDVLTVRDYVIMFSAFYGGPVIGIPVALITGAGTFMIGGAAAAANTVSCLIAGILGCALWYVAGKKFPDTLSATIMMLLSKVFTFSLIVLMTPGSSGAVPYDIMLLTTIMNVSCMMLTSHFHRLSFKKEAA